MEQQKAQQGSEGFALQGKKAKPDDKMQKMLDEMRKQHPKEFDELEKQNEWTTMTVASKIEAIKTEIMQQQAQKIMHNCVEEQEQKIQVFEGLIKHPGFIEKLATPRREWDLPPADYTNEEKLGEWFRGLERHSRDYQEVLKLIASD